MDVGGGGAGAFFGAGGGGGSISSSSSSTSVFNGSCATDGYTKKKRLQQSSIYGNFLFEPVVIDLMLTTMTMNYLLEMIDIEEKLLLLLSDLLG